MPQDSRSPKVVLGLALIAPVLAIVEVFRLFKSEKKNKRRRIENRHGRHQHGRARSCSPRCHHGHARSLSPTCYSRSSSPGWRRERDREQDRIRQMYDDERDMALRRAARGWERRSSCPPRPRYDFVEPSRDRRMMVYEEPPRYQEEYEGATSAHHGKRRH